MTTYDVIVFLPEGFEEIEAVTTIDILRRGGVNTLSVSLTDRLSVTGSHDITVTADALFDDLNTTDVTGTMLILPGGPGTVNYKEHLSLMNLIKTHGNNGGLLAAICAAPTVLGHLGLLKDKTAVCYPGMESQLGATKIGETNVITYQNITTSKGPATSTAFAIQLVSILKGAETARKVAKNLLYTG